MSDQPPQSFERDLSPAEERDVLLNFMGNAYGEIKKIDNHITSQSSTLQATGSDQVKRNIEQVFSETPQPAQSAQTEQPIIQQPAVQVEQSVKPVQQTPVEPQINDSQLIFSFDVNEKDQLFDLIEKVVTRLDKLHRKVDALIESDKNSKVTSLPVKRQSKKKSANQKEEH